MSSPVVSASLRLPARLTGWARGWGQPRPRGWGRIAGLEGLCGQIAALCGRETLSVDEVMELVRDDPAVALGEKMALAIEQILAGGLPDEPTTAVVLAERLEERLGERLDTGQISAPMRRLGRRAALVFSGFLGFGCLYIVVGGLLEGQSERFGSLPGPVALLMFGLALAFLGLFEALHTSGTQLRLADLRGLAADLPRAYRLNRRLRDDEGMERFLAGRQIVVVITVFFVAGLSSFPSMSTLPFVETPVPSLLDPIVEFGIPGALVVLWTAQLAPQFYATRNALQLMNTRAATWALDLAFFLESIGLAQPSRWIPRRGSSGRIPLSPALRWDQDADELDGDGLISVNRRWRCGSDRAQAQIASATSVRRAGHVAVADSNLVLPAAPSSLRLMAEIKTPSGASRPVAPTNYSEEPLPSGDRRFRKVIAPAIGPFAEGECAQALLEADYASPIGRDAVPVERPARFVLWRLALSEQPLHFSHVRLRIYRMGDHIGDLARIGDEIHLFPLEGSDGLPVVTYSHPFPPANSLFVFDWEVTWS